MTSGDTRSFDDLRYWRLERSNREALVHQRTAEWQAAGTNTYREALQRLDKAKSLLAHADSMVRKYEEEAKHD